MNYSTRALALNIDIEFNSCNTIVLRVWRSLSSLRNSSIFIDNIYRIKPFNFVFVPWYPSRFFPSACHVKASVTSHRWISRHVHIHSHSSGVHHPNLILWNKQIMMQLLPPLNNIKSSYHQHGHHHHHQHRRCQYLRMSCTCTLGTFRRFVAVKVISVIVGLFLDVAQWFRQTSTGGVKSPE